MRIVLLLISLCVTSRALADALTMGFTCQPGSATAATGFVDRGVGNFSYMAIRPGPRQNQLTTDCVTFYQGSEVKDRWVSYKAGTAQNLACWVSVAPGAGGWIFALNTTAGGASALTCTIATSAKSCSDTAHTVAIAAQDGLTINWSVTSGTEAQSPAGGCVFELVY